MKFKPDDISLEKWYVKKGGSMVRQIVAIDSRHVRYRSFAFYEGDYYGSYLQGGRCTIATLANWAEREATTAEIDAMDVQGAEAAEQEMKRQLRSLLTNDELLDEVRQRGLMDKE